MHFKSHLKKDKFCQKQTNPEDYDDIFELQNSQACEQTFRWFGAFGSIIRVMGMQRAFFFMRLMAREHNKRITADYIQHLEPKGAALERLRVAYRVSKEVGESVDDVKKRLIDVLLAGKTPYDTAAVRAFDEDASKKVAADAEMAEANVEVATAAAAGATAGVKRREMSS